jgi:hypothetical protein
MELADRKPFFFEEGVQEFRSCRMRGIGTLARFPSGLGAAERMGIIAFSEN